MGNSTLPFVALIHDVISMMEKSIIELNRGNHYEIVNGMSCLTSQQIFSYLCYCIEWWWQNSAMGVFAPIMVWPWIQWCALENQQSPFYVVNEVTLRGQNPSLKFCWPLELFTQLKRGLDLLTLKIWLCRSKGCKVASH